MKVFSLGRNKTVTTMSEARSLTRGYKVKILDVDLTRSMGKG